MVTFGSTISTTGGITGTGGGTIGTKEARDKIEKAKTREKDWASEFVDATESQIRSQEKGGLLNKIYSGIGSLLTGNSNENVQGKPNEISDKTTDRNVTKPNQDYYGEPFRIGEIGGFTLESGPFGLGTSLHGPKHRLPEFLQQNQGALLQSALNAQRYGSGNINVGSKDETGNAIRDVIALESYNHPKTAKEFIDNIYQNPNSGIENLVSNNMWVNALKELGYAGIDEGSGQFQTGVSPALRNRGNEGFFNNVQSLMGIK